MRKTLIRAEKKSRRILKSPLGYSVEYESKQIGRVVFKALRGYKRVQFIAYFGRRMVCLAQSTEIGYVMPKEKFCGMAHKILVKELMRGRYTPRRYYR